MIYKISEKVAPPRFFTFWHHWARPKGQLIIKCPFDFFHFPKKPMKFSALASKERPNQKNKGTFYS
jgi:hypothetical protein